MPDAIPGAEYYDTVLGINYICNGTVDESNGPRVVLEVDETGETFRVPLGLFVDTESIEITDLP